MVSTSCSQVVATVALAATVVLMIIYWVRWSEVSSEQGLKNGGLEQSARETNVKLKTILFWNSYFGMPNFGMGEGSGQELFINNRCPVNTCFGTSDRSLLPVEDFDAVIFHAYNMKHDFPLRRNPSQKYVYFLMESPKNSNSKIGNLTYFFNWTMTYRLDSDILSPYALVFPINATELTQPDLHPHWLKPDLDFNDSSKLKLVEQKTKLVAWFVSNCHTFSKREDYVKELSKYIPVDVYGKCGNNSCPRKLSEKCYEMLSADYKFYLALENSLCRDYVTEKLFGTMEHDIIPVVYGAANYSNHAPPMSYINIFDFTSARELAKNLLFLDKNPREYVKYFWWKQHYKINNWNKSMCKLCEMLHQQHEPKSYPDIYKWWSGSDVCTNPRVG